MGIKLIVGYVGDSRCGDRPPEKCFAKGAAMNKPSGITSPLLPRAVEARAFQCGYYRTIGSEVADQVGFEHLR